MVIKYLVVVTVKVDCNPFCEIKRLKEHACMRDPVLLTYKFFGFSKELIKR